MKAKSHTDLLLDSAIVGRFRVGSYHDFRLSVIARRRVLSLSKDPRSSYMEHDWREHE